MLHAVRYHRHVHLWTAAPAMAMIGRVGPPCDAAWVHLRIQPGGRTRLGSAIPPAQL